MSSVLNENHKRHLQSSSRYIDKLLSEAEHAMTDAGSPSPIREHADDTTPIQRKVTHDYIVRIREAVRRVMEELEVPPVEPRCGAIWAAGINFMFCAIALSDLTADKMRAYGELSEEGATAVESIRSEIGALLNKLSAYLAKGAGGDLQARLERLGETGDEVRLLAEIERIITAHGLVEFRGALTMLVDRFESAAFEVGVFGRVSSGKSSLLNYILQTDMLPVGVTPVTANPARISHGPVPEAGIEFAEAQPKIIPLSKLAEFATEEKNPSNKKHVTGIFVKLPAARLREGVTFVDTPGLGSLAVAGAEETVAYLPRCDLGLVLVDASSGLTQDDLVVVQALYQASATAAVLISKSDLLGAGDRDRMIDYVKTNLRTQLGVEPPVHAISIFGPDATLCDRWFEEELRPLPTHHRELIVASRKRKVGALREAVIAALERREQVGGEEDAGKVAPDDALEFLREGEGALERAQGQAFFLTGQITKSKPQIIDAASEAISGALLESDNIDSGEIFGATLSTILAEPVAATLRSLEQTRQTLAGAMQLARGESETTALSEELPTLTGMPALDVSEISKQIQIEKPAVLSLLGRGALRAHLRRRLDNEFDRLLFDFLNLHANRLRRWMEQSVQAMRGAFAASADIQRAHLAGVPLDVARDPASVRNDLCLLRDWRATSTIAPDPDTS
jgi:GTP-binding protein EngB required for normal cell division